MNDVKCPVCGASGVDHCATATGRDHRARGRAELARADAVRARQDGEGAPPAGEVEPTPRTPRPRRWAGPHHEVIVDALQRLHTQAPARRAEAEEALRALGEWHNHHAEDQHCDPRCPAWRRNRPCGCCGKRHTVEQAPAVAT